jgi:hypothetical protein
VGARSQSESRFFSPWSLPARRTEIFSWSHLFLKNENFGTAALTARTQEIETAPSKTGPSRALGRRLTVVVPRNRHGWNHPRPVASR